MARNELGREHVKSQAAIPTTSFREGLYLSVPGFSFEKARLGFIFATAKTLTVVLRRRYGRTRVV